MRDLRQLLGAHQRKKFEVAATATNTTPSLARNTSLPTHTATSKTQTTAKAAGNVMLNAPQGGIGVMVKRDNVSGCYVVTKIRYEVYCVTLDRQPLIS